MKKASILFLLSILTMGAFSQNTIGISFFGENLPENEIVISDTDSGERLLYVETKSIDTDSVYSYSLADRCYTITLTGIPSPKIDDLPSGIALYTKGDTATVAESTHYFFEESTEIITFSFVNGSYSAHCNVDSRENYCLEDVTKDGMITIEDVLQVMTLMGQNCEGIKKGNSNNFLDQIIHSELSMINFNADVIQLKESINYWIITPEGKIIENRRSNAIDLTSLASGVYIILTETEARKFVVNR